MKTCVRFYNATTHGGNGEMRACITRDGGHDWHDVTLATGLEAVRDGATSEVAIMTERGAIIEWMGLEGAIITQEATDA